MNQSTQLSLVPGHNRNYRPVVSESWCCISIHPTFPLSLCKYLHQFLGNSALFLSLTAPDLVKLGRGIVTDLAVLIQCFSNAIHNKREDLYGLAHGLQGRILILLIRLEEIKNGPYRIQAPDQAKHLFLQHKGPFHLSLFQCLPVIDEVLKRKFILIQGNPFKLISKVQFQANGIEVGHKTHLFHALPPRFKQAMGPDQFTDTVKSYFCFKLLWINQCFYALSIIHQPTARFPPI